MSKRMKVKRKDLDPYTEKSIKEGCNNLICVLNDTEAGKIFEVSVIEMTDEEYEALPAMNMKHYSNLWD